MPVPVCGDDGIATHSRQHAPGQMARASVQLVVPNALDDDLVEPDARYAKPRHRRTSRERPTRERDAVCDPLACRGDRGPRLLRLPLLPREVCLVRTASVPQAGVAD